MQRTVKSNRRRVSAGFSAIDILVIIAIIAVLVALLMPVLSKVREKARRSAAGIVRRS